MVSLLVAVLVVVAGTRHHRLLIVSGFHRINCTLNIAKAVPFGGCRSSISD